MVTFKRTNAKFLANLNKTRFELWFENIKKEYGKEGMQFILDDMDWQRRTKGIEKSYQTFAKKFYNYMIAKDNGISRPKEIQYLNRKDVSYMVNSVALYLHAKFGRNFVPYSLK